MDTRFNFVLLNEHDREANRSYIRGNKPDYLLEIKDLELNITDSTHETEIAFPEPLDNSFFLNFGDIFLCAVNSFLSPNNLSNSLSTLVAAAMQTHFEISEYIESAKKSASPSLNAAYISKLNSEYKQLSKAVAFCAIIGIATFEDTELEGFFSVAASELLSDGEFFLGEISPKKLQDNLRERNLFREIDVRIVYHGDGNEEYQFKNIFSLVGFEVRKLFSAGVYIKTCDNCGRFFIPAARRDEKYCDFPFRGNKTCKQLAFTERLKKDDIIGTYRKIYKTQNARKQRNAHIPDIAERFDIWKAGAKNVLKQCRAGEISTDDMISLISPADWMTGGDTNGDDKTN